MKTEDVVLDAALVAFSNAKDPDVEHPGAFGNRIRLIIACCNGRFRLRHNKRLREEYQKHARLANNDYIALVFELIDQKHSSVWVAKGTLPRAVYSKAKHCRWPDHDQHLLAAAHGGTKPIVYTTESKLATCHACIYRDLRVRIQNI